MQLTPNFNFDTKTDVYFDLNLPQFATGVTEKYYTYVVNSEIQMRSVSFISFEDKNDKGDPATRTVSGINNITDIDCFRA